MRIYVPDVKRKKGEVVRYQFTGDTADKHGLNRDGDGSLNLDLNVRSSGDEIIIGGTLKAVEQSVCSRCLQPFAQQFKSDFHEAFTVVPAQEDDDPTVLAAKAANQLTVAGDFLYLDEYIRQVFILAQSYNPLCSTDCKGICAGCGVDLNSGACRCCKEPLIDERLLKLKELKPPKE